MTTPTVEPCPVCGAPLLVQSCPACITDSVLADVARALDTTPLVFGVTDDNRAVVRAAIQSAFELGCGDIDQHTDRLMARWTEEPHRLGTRLPSVAATYVSVWDGGVTIHAPCRWSVPLRVAFAIEAVNVDGVEVCERAYIELLDGTQIDVDSQAETADDIPSVNRFIPTYRENE